MRRVLPVGVLFVVLLLLVVWKESSRGTPAETTTTTPRSASIRVATLTGSLTSKTVLAEKLQLTTRTFAPRSFIMRT